MQAKMDFGKHKPGADGPHPRVTLGLPVFNGENLLRETLDGILSQTFGDFELVISDNASDDATAEICRAAAEADPRIRYFRQPKNIGAAANYDYVFFQARGEYFKWCAHDDLLGERFLEVCVDWLDNHCDYVGALPKEVKIVDAAGSPLETVHFDLDPEDTGPGERFAHYIGQGWIQCSPFFSLFRRDVLKFTGLHGDYTSSDRVLIGEMLLQGRLGFVIGADFLFRRHEAQYSRRAREEQDFGVAWLNPRNEGRRVFKHMRYILEYFRSIRSAGLPAADRLKAYRAVAGFAWSERRKLIKELCLPLYRNGRATPIGLTLKKRIGSIRK